MPSVVKEMTSVVKEETTPTAKDMMLQNRIHHQQFVVARHVVSSRVDR